MIAAMDQPQKGANEVGNEPARNEQVRKRGLPPLLNESHGGGKLLFLTCSFLTGSINSSFVTFVPFCG